MHDGLILSGSRGAADSKGGRSNPWAVLPVIAPTQWAFPRLRCGVHATVCARRYLWALHP